MNKYPIVSETKALGDFFDRTRESAVIPQGEAWNYIIPYYQRPYEWQWNDKQLKGLVSSFINLSSLDSQNIDEQPFNFIDDEYVVFGTIQINKNQGYEIIDGQQRLVSFWMFIKAIDKICRTESQSNLSFVVDNQISSEYDNQFQSFSEDGQNNQYAKNYHELYSVVEKIGSPERLCELREYLLNNVLITLMVTSFEDNVEKTVGLFDSLNTKGLDLGMKDTFKIKYFKFLKSNMKDCSKEKAKFLFDHINNAYECCNGQGLQPMFIKGPETLIDTFKLWIIMNDSDLHSKLPEEITASSNKFFGDSKDSKDSKYSVWKKALSDNDARDLQSFIEIAKTIQQTQIIIQNLNGGVYGEMDATLVCSDELLENCGYWYYRDLIFVFSHAIRMNKSSDGGTELDVEDVKRALSFCEVVWKICAIYKAEDTRVRHSVLRDIAQKIVIKFLQNPTMNADDIKDGVIVGNEYASKFRNVITGEVFLNKQRWFIVTLSYLCECSVDESGSFIEQRRKLFHAEKKEQCEIEHIISRAACDTDSRQSECMNHIGNLVFLNNGINSALGVKTKGLEDKRRMAKITLEEALETDFIGKISRNTTKNYVVESEQNHNVAIRKLLSNIPNEINTDSICALIEQRDSDLQNSILALFKDVMPCEE